MRIKQINNWIIDFNKTYNVYQLLHGNIVYEEFFKLKDAEKFARKNKDFIKTKKYFIYKSKIYYNQKGLAYFIFKNHRYYLKDLLYNRKENSIFITISNCLGYKLYDICISNEEYMTYKIEEIIL